MLKDFLDISFVIITLNEENNLKRCFASLPVGCEVIVVDSGSTDNTKEVALENQARFFERDFDHYEGQKNFAIKKASRTWIFSIDADEQLTEALRNSILANVNNPRQNHIGFRVKRRLVFMGRKMRFGKTSDDPIRLFRKDSGYFSGKIHEKISLSGSCHKLQGIMWHYSYSSIEDYFKRFNRYTTMVAKQHWLEEKKFIFAKHIFRPFSEFFIRYIVFLGFLDGYPGFTYALYSSIYAFTKYAKLLELKIKEQQHENQ